MNFLRRVSGTSIQLLLLVLFAGNSRAEEVRGVWRSLAPMPAARQEVGVVELSGEVYVIGGLTATGAGTAAVEIYNPATNSWRAGPSLPGALHHVAAAAVGGKVYSIGGFFRSSFAPVATVYELDPGAGVWTERAPLPAAAGGLAAAVIDGKIYAVGGTEPGGTDSNRLAVYDPAANQWTQLTPMPTARNHLAAGAIDGKLYVIGGRSPSRATLEVYDPATNQWQTKTPMPTARSGLAAAVFKGLLFVFGGEIPGVFNQTEVYDPAEDNWFSLTPMAVPRHGIGAAVVGNRIIIPGGATIQGFAATNHNDEFAVLDHLQILAQLADGLQITSQALLSNFGQDAATLMLELRDRQGSLLPPGLLSFGGNQTLEPRASSVSTTPGASNPPQEGSARVFSDRPILAQILFSSDFGFAGVLGRTPTQSFGVPVLRNASANLDSGIAIANASRFPNRVTFKLLDPAGQEVASATVDLQPNGQTAQLLDQLFPNRPPGPFQGTVIGMAERPVGAMAILLRNNQFATLPVQTQGVF